MQSGSWSRNLQPRQTACSTTCMAAAGGDEGRLLVDGDGEPIALAFHGTDGWVAASFLFRHPTVELIEQFEGMNGQILEEDRAVFTAAVREYYSNLLCKEVPPAIEDLNPVRRGILSASSRSTGAGATMGNASTAAAVRVSVRSCSGTSGMSPLSYDNDASLISPRACSGAPAPGGDDVSRCTGRSRFIEPVPGASGS